MHLLITTDQFLVGGRESYIVEYLNYLKEYGITASLLTSSIDWSGLTRLFEEVRVCESSSCMDLLREWLKKGEEIIVQKRPSLLWAHHYDLFPAWLISRRYGIPLVTTFHGPLSGAGRPNDPMQALGMVLAIHHGEILSGVSEEILCNLRVMNPQNNDIYLIPNSVALKGSAGYRMFQGEIPQKFIVVSRPEKLSHLRKTALLFSAYVNKTGKGQLTIVSGRSSSDVIKDKRSIISTMRHAIRVLGGKWCLDQGTRFLLCLPRINFHGYTSEPRQLIRNCDVVVGMGRVLLEGLSEGKLSVLVGYDEACGVVSAETLDKYRWSNFSGRGIPGRSVEEVCEELLSFSKRNIWEDPEPVSKIGMTYWGPRFMEVLEYIRSRPWSVSNEQSQLSNEICKEVRACSIRPEEVFSRVCGGADGDMFKSLYLLASG